MVITGRCLLQTCLFFQPIWNRLACQRLQLFRFPEIVWLLRVFNLRQWLGSLGPQLLWSQPGPLSQAFSTASAPGLTRSRHPSLQSDNKLLALSETVSSEVGAAFNSADGRTLSWWGGSPFPSPLHYSSQWPWCHEGGPTVRGLGLGEGGKGSGVKEVWVTTDPSWRGQSRSPRAACAQSGQPSADQQCPASPDEPLWQYLPFCGNFPSNHQQGNKTKTNTGLLLCFTNTPFLLKITVLSRKRKEGYSLCY